MKMQIWDKQLEQYRVPTEEEREQSFQELRKIIDSFDSENEEQTDKKDIEVYHNIHELVEEAKELCKKYNLKEFNINSYGRLEFIGENGLEGFIHGNVSLFTGDNKK